MGDTIAKVEFESAYNYIERIVQEDVGSMEITDHIPTINDMSDANKVFKGKLSILFVDMRKSTDLTDKIDSKNMVKVYRAFIRCVVQCIRYSGGESRQFAGDGIMGVFQDDKDNGENSEQLAVKAARYIITMIDYCLNPLLFKFMDGLTVGCGVGIGTGTVLVTKVGMRGKEIDENSENEMNIVWTGQTTNYASRFCSLAKAGEIFIDESTYSGAQDEGKWLEDVRTKGNKAFSGFAIEHYYLPFQEDIGIEKKVCEKDKDEINFTQDVFNDLKKNASELINEIIKKSEELTKKMNELEKKEQNLVAKEARLIKEFEENTKEFEISMVDRRYMDIREIFSATHCENELIKKVGKDYWMKLIDEIYECGKILGKSKDEVTSDLDCYLVQIYLNCFPDYDKAYDALCIQAEYSTWLNETIVRDVVKKSMHWARLKRILEKKANKSNKYAKALLVLKEMGY